jgi:hypothetical protein
MCASSPAPATGCATRCRIGTSGATHAATTRARNRSGILLQLTGHDWDLNLRATNHPEFDAWRWNDYWVPLDVVVEFKRGVYEMALTELARYLPRHDHRNRYLRSNVRARETRLVRWIISGSATYPSNARSREGLRHSMRASTLA